MWHPVDSTAIPTPEDAMHAKTAILEIENELKETLIALEKAKHRIEELKTDLSIRRAWIAPIRKINFDALARVFEFAGEDDPKSALRISAVSRQWREVALYTPRAWSFLDIRHCSDESVIRLFLQRSAQRKLHVAFPLEPPIPLSTVAARLRCLAISTLPLNSSGITFPNVEKLRLSGYVSTALSELDITRFPGLRTLIIDGYLSSVSHLEKRNKIVFPPLHTFSFTMNPDSAWLDIVEGCQNTLTHMGIYVDDLGDWESKNPICPRVTLPRLKNLYVVCLDSDVDSWEADLITPALELYFESSNDNPVRQLIHGDIGNVKHLGTMGRIPDLTDLPMMESLMLDENPDVIFHVLSEISSDNSLCPRLKLIEQKWQGAEDEEIIKQVAKVNEIWGREITFKSREGVWEEDRNYFLDVSCGKGMPCS